MNAQDQAFARNVEFQKAWSLPFDAIDPTAADDYFAYLKNNGAKTIVIHRISSETTVAGTLEVHGVSGTAGGGQTARTPVNKTVDSGPAPDITFETDPDITGLTDQGILEFIALDAAGEEVVRNFDEGIRVLTGRAVALLWDTSTGTLTGALHIYEEA